VTLEQISGPFVYPDGAGYIGEPAMNRDEEYREQAERAEHEARRAISDIDREAWLRIAPGWRGLLSKRAQSDDESK
jgi:hypothetical protein